MELTLEAFKSLIKDRCGFTFRNDSSYTLEVSLQKRMSDLKAASNEIYLQMLRNDQEEMDRLIELITINETYFLREPRHFKLLVDTVMPEMLDRKRGSEKVRILSAGCSTGEEAYSILLALTEKYGMGIRNRVSIIGVDIDRNAIRMAQEGIFGNKSFRSDDALLKKYVVHAKDKRFELVPYLKEGVEFQVFNLLTHPYPDFLKNIDIIFYRNVSIYFAGEVQKLIFQRLSEILNPEGFLFLSSAETYFHNIGILFLKEYGDVFVYKKKVEMEFDDRRKYHPASKTIPPISTPPFAPRVKSAIPTPVAAVQPSAKYVEKRARQDVRELFDEALACAMRKEYAPVIEKVDALLEKDPAFIKAYSLKASVLINRQELDAAREMCRRIMALDEWNLEGYLLLGIIAKVEDKMDEALAKFKGALYIRSSCWLAHFYLADIYFAQGDHSGAYGEYGVAVRLLEKHGMEDHGLTYFPLSFPVDQLIHLCRHNMDKLRRMAGKAVHSA
ncbi:MAG: hypothetical protein HZA04_10460 [Nitrospinae bacterium]|nr:hypothetical protein [Nitrospinota bacterium]